MSRPKKDPALKKVQQGCKFSQWVLNWLKENDKPIGPSFEKALIEKYELKPPKGE